MQNQCKTCQFWHQYERIEGFCSKGAEICLTWTYDTDTCDKWEKREKWKQQEHLCIRCFKFFKLNMHDPRNVYFCSKCYYDKFILGVEDKYYPL